MLENVMPFLMSTSGLEASAQEVQMFALGKLLFLEFPFVDPAYYLALTIKLRYGIESY
jgi:hypothetical protein